MIEVSNEDIMAAAAEAGQGPVEGTQFKLHVFTNDKTNPFLIKQLEMFYQCTLASKIGLMHAKHAESGRIDTLLVGVEQGPDGLITYPLAKILDGDELLAYLPPDGNGGYLTDAVEDVAVN